MKKSEEFGEIIYIVAYTLWMGVMFLRLTYFRDWVEIGEVTRDVQHVVLALLVLRYALNPDLSWKGIGKLAVLVLFMFAAFSYGKLAFAVSLALVFSVGNISFEKLLKITLLIQLIGFVITVTCSQIGIIEDYMWITQTRRRHGLGFTHCLLGSHFVLFMSLICVTLIKKMKWWLAIAIFAANYVMYIYTDARTTIILSVFLVVAGLIAGLLERFFKPSRLLAVLSFAVPFAFWGVSAYGAKMFTPESPKMVWLNDFFNGRLLYMNRALKDYGVTLLGQKIKWIGESTLKANPELVYNYVDNAYMQAFFTYGVLFTVLLCAGWGLVLYRNILRGKYVMAVVVLVVLIHGIINPQMIELVYNPFFLCIGTLFENKNREGEV